MSRPVLIPLLAVVLGYLLLCGWFYAQQRQFMYFPQSTQTDLPPPNLKLAVDGATLRGWMVNPGQPDAVIYFGGNAEAVHDLRGSMARWFPGRTSYLPAYRGFGASSGTPGEHALYADALVLFDHVQSRHRGGSVAVVGRSLGSGVASYLAAHRPVAKLVLVTPFDSMARVAQTHYPWLPARWLLRDRYDSARHLQRYAGPSLVIRAGRDQIIPAAATERLVAAIPVRPQVVVLPTADHNFASDDPRFVRALSEFLR